MSELKNFNLKELQKKASELNVPLFGAVNITNLPFMKEYVEGDYASIDRMVARKKGFFLPFFNSVELETEDIGVVLSEFQADVNAFLTTSANNYQRFYNLSKMQYDPIFNYDMTEISTDTTVDNDATTMSHGNITTTDNQGASSVERTIGEANKTLNYGQTQTTSNIGVVNNTDTIGATTNSTTSSVAGFNSTEFTNSEKSDEVKGLQTNAHNESARTNTDIISSKVDSEKDAEKTDTDAYSARNDTSTTIQEDDAVNKSGTSTLSHELSRKGNIGVTTSQQMAESEIHLWESFNFYNMIIDDIIKNLCGYSDCGYDTYLTPLWNSLI